MKGCGVSEKFGVTNCKKIATSTLGERIQVIRRLFILHIVATKGVSSSSESILIQTLVVSYLVNL